MSRHGTVKLAYIGGGSMFVPSILHGIARAMKDGVNSAAAFAAEVALFDVQPEKARRMARYGEVLAAAWDVPLSVHVAGERPEAVAGADVVMLSVALYDEIQRLHEGLAMDDPPDRERWHGLSEMAEAVAVAPFYFDIAREVRETAPGALVMGLVNPTDVMAGAIQERYGVRSAGICVEVYGLIDALAYYFKVPEAAIELDHVGVNHDGWVLRLRVDGQDGYALWRDRWEVIVDDPQFHPGNRLMIEILRLTGHLRSSAYHRWPLVLDPAPAPRSGGKFPRKRELYTTALDGALRTGQPIVEPEGIHPESAPLNYPGTGRAVGRLLRGIATGRAERLTLQVPNRGAILNWDTRTIVEVPVQVAGESVSPLPMGEAPEWLSGTTRLAALQRRRFIDYILDPALDTLKQALFTVPTCGTIGQYNRFAERLHRLYEGRIGAASS